MTSFWTENKKNEILIVGNISGKFNSNKNILLQFLKSQPDQWYEWGIDYFNYYDWKKTFSIEVAQKELVQLIDGSKHHTVLFFDYDHELERSKESKLFSTTVGYVIRRFV